MSAPLSGIKIIEFAGLGPTPFAGMMMADMGADVLRIDGPNTFGPSGDFDICARGKRAIKLDLKNPADKDVALSLLAKADGLIEGFRPNVMERLGLGPDVVLAANPALVYGRMTGWGQFGPLSQKAGHDLNYIAISGALNAMGPKHLPPPVPLNMIGDYGGGAMMLVSGMLAAMIAAKTSGKGQVVDAAMSDGAALMGALFHSLLGMGVWRNQRGGNLLDGAAPFYRCYGTKDDLFVAVGAIEPQFFAQLVAGLGLSDKISSAAQMDFRGWPEMAELFAATIKEKTRDEWVAQMAPFDACFSPVLDWHEAKKDPHNMARGAYISVGGVDQPQAAPRFSAFAPRQQPASLVKDVKIENILTFLGKIMGKLEGTTGRRRIYLMRHGHVDYGSKEVVQSRDPSIARLTDLGVEQAHAAGAAFADVHLDIALCSGLRRTRETADIVLSHHKNPPILEDLPGLSEMKSGHFIPFDSREELAAALTFSFENAGAPDATFFEGGEKFTDAQDRAVAAIESVLARPNWATALVVAHEAINRLILGWMCKAGPAAAVSFEQDVCCVNILDFDLVPNEDGESRRIERRIIKAVNITPYGWLKSGMNHTSFEAIFTKPYSSAVNDD